MERSFEVDSFPALTRALDNLQISSDSPSLLIRQNSRSLVADPGMRSSTARVHPQHMREPQILNQSCMHDFDGHGDIFPAFLADVSLLTAGPDIIVVREIDIED